MPTRRRPHGPSVAALQTIAERLDELLKLVHRQIEIVGATAPTQPNPTWLFDLSPREREVLSLMHEDLTYNEIAARLGLSPRTVQKHAGKLLAKLGAATREDAEKFYAGFLTERADEPRPQLSARERQILQLLDLPMSYKAIAESLGISVSTVAKHTERLYRKLGVNSRVEAVDWLRRKY